MIQGIITGCDRNQEWLLPWWWAHYSAHNQYPVAFIDFGMTDAGRAWCRERGVCLRAPAAQRWIVGKNAVAPERGAAWEEHFGKKIWSRRRIWLKKPFALLLSPFPFSIWIDLDCRVKGDLEPLFNCLGIGADIAIKREPDHVQKNHRDKGFIECGEVNYECGVIVFRQEAEILRQWTQEIIERNDQYVYDQHALSRAVVRFNPRLFELPPLYNWSMANGSNPHSLVDHYHGGFLKQMIRDQLKN